MAEPPILAGTLPAARGFVVEYPGYIRSLDAALASLGGEAELARCRQADCSISLHLRPSDTLAHPLASEPPRRVSGMLLRVAPSGRVSVSSLVDAGFRFSGLADAQYLSAPPPKRSRLAADELAACPDSVEEAGEEPLALLPPLFFHSDAPIDCAFRERATGGAERAGEEAGAQRALGAPAAPPASGGPPVVQEIDFRAAGVPAPLAADSEWASPPDVAAVLGPLFEERGAWSFAALSTRFPKELSIRAHKYLPSHAYKFVNGPWHRLWVRRGLDPRINSVAKAWQCFDFRLPGEWYPKEVLAATRKQQPAPGVPRRGDFHATHEFRVLPARRSSFFQLCDLKNQPLITSLIQNNAESTCDEHTGWYRKTTLDSIKLLVRQAFEKIALAEGYSVVPPKERKNSKHGKAARIGAVLESAKARLESQGAGGAAAPAAAAAEDGEDSSEDEEEEEEDLRPRGRARAPARAAPARAKPPARKEAPARVEGLLGDDEYELLED